MQVVGIPGLQMARPGKASTMDLLHWPDKPEASAQIRTPVRISATNDSKGFASASDESYRDYSASRPGIRTHQPAGGASTFAFGEHLSAEEAEALLKRRPGSETKKKEMSGNNIFADEPGAVAPTPERTGMKLVQAPSQIKFGEPDTASPKKANSVAEIAKQRELCGSDETEDDAHRKKQQSNAKVKELVGSNIFAPPTDGSPAKHPAINNATIAKPEIDEEEEPEGDLFSSLSGMDSTPERKRSLTQKMAELCGNDIFKNGANSSAEKHLSNAKLKEMSGSNIFADEKPVPRDCLGGVRKPPGGESTIALV